MTIASALAAEQRVVLSPVRWGVYSALADGLESPGLRLTYDRWSLEIMVTSMEHERLKSLIAVRSASSRWSSKSRSRAAGR